MTLDLSRGSWPILVCGYSFVTMVAHYRLAIGLLLAGERAGTALPTVATSDTGYTAPWWLVLFPTRRQPESVLQMLSRRDTSRTECSVNGKRWISTIYDFNATNAQLVLFGPTIGRPLFRGIMRWPVVNVTLVSSISFFFYLKYSWYFEQFSRTFKKKKKLFHIDLRRKVNCLKIV